LIATFYFKQTPGYL